MNPDSIGILGYLGLALAGAVLVTWLAYWKIKRRVIARLGLVLSLGALACATIHSATHVNRIEIDPSEQLAKIEAQKEARRQAALDLRGDEVAQIQFAEDDGDEFLDKAGLEESDLNYYDSLEEPAWKREKRTRSAGGADDDDLEALIDTEEAEGGADVQVLEKEQEPEPILMSESEVVTAHRLDRWNLRVSRALPLLALLLVGYDYLRRANRYAEASFPLPLPSALTGAVTPMPTVVERPDRPRRPLEKELVWLARRGDAFIYFTDDALKVAKALETLTPGASNSRKFEVMALEDDRIDDEFVFEALWYGRACFIVHSPQRIQHLTERFTELLKQRSVTRARVRQVAHIVWDLDTDPPGILLSLIESTGLSLFRC